MIDFNSPIDITSAYELPPDMVDVVQSVNEGEVFGTPIKKKGRPRKEKPKITLDIPKYTPKPITKKKYSGPIKKGEYRGIETLSKEDKDYIADNARRISVDEIADNLNKRRVSVFSYMERHGLLSDDDKRDSRIKRAILNDLHNQEFWKFVKQSYSQEEISYFEDSWCSFIIHLDDNITPFEQMQLRRLIETQISIDRLTIQKQKYISDATSLEEEIQDLRDSIQMESDPEEIGFLQAEISKLQAAQSGLTLLRTNSDKDLDNLVKAQSNLMKDLDVTRAKRVEKFDMSDKTWAKMLLEIKENPRLKKQMGAMAYISMLATERMRHKLTIDYTYSDGEVHPPLILPEGCVSVELGTMVDALYAPKIE